MINIGVGAIILAIWLVILFFGKAIGLSMLLFFIPFSYCFICILEENNKIKNTKSKILLIPIFLLSSTYFIFDNSFFNTINVFIIPMLLCVMILNMIGESFEINLDTIWKIAGSFLNPLSFIEESIINFIDSVKEKLKINVKADKEHKIKKIIKALLITIPIVIIIIVLLSSADETFAHIFIRIFEKIIDLLIGMNISTVIVKIICIAISFFYLMGLFYFISIKYEVIDEIDKKDLKKHDNFTIKMILISLNIVYLIFSYIQIKSLFIAKDTFNYASFARQGFFQLMVVSIINMVTILIAKNRQNKDENVTNRFINNMSLLMIVFTFIIVISAGVRMYFYESAYGYTLLRLLVYCALFTESILLIPTIMYILDKNINLPKVYFIVLITIYLCMNFANFDNIIAKRNVDRYIQTGKIDIYYLEEDMGADAINQIIRLLEVSTDDNNVKTETRQYIEEIYNMLNEENMDFRDFNISKILAKIQINKL